MEGERLDAARVGVIMIGDLEGMGWRHYNHTAEQVAAQVYQDTFPMRWGMMVLMNPPFIIKAILGLMRVFLKKKIMNRIRILSKESLTDFIDRKFIPREFGGDFEWPIENHYRTLQKWEREYFYHREEVVVSRSCPEVYHPGLKRSLEVREDGAVYRCCEQGEESEGCCCWGCGRVCVAKGTRIAKGCLCVDENGSAWRKGISVELAKTK
jgi:hypothetical protein